MIAASLGAQGSPDEVDVAGPVGDAGSLDPGELANGCCGSCTPTSAGVSDACAVTLGGSSEKSAHPVISTAATGANAQARRDSRRAPLFVTLHTSPRLRNARRRVVR